MSDRPLSPHLQVYRLPLLPIVSILTRAAGIALSLGLVVFAFWLMALGSGAEAYAWWTGLLTSPLGLIALIGWTFALMWYMAGGVRHLIWDAGKGLSLEAAERGAYMTIAFSILGTAAVWLWIWSAS